MIGRTLCDCGLWWKLFSFNHSSDCTESQVTRRLQKEDPTPNLDEIKAWRSPEIDDRVIDASDMWE